MKQKKSTQSKKAPSYGAGKRDEKREARAKTREKREVRAGEERIEREVRARTRRRVRPVVFIFAAAVVLTVATVLYVYFSLGLRYLVYPNGVKFLGRCAGNEPIIGTVYYPSGDTAKYDVETKSLTYSNGDSYIGELKDFFRNGMGRLVVKDKGEEYEGTFSEDAYSGTGKIRFANGDVYEGEMVNGRREGKGTYTWASGAV